MAGSLQHLWVVEQIIELPPAIAFLLKAIILKNYDPCTLFLVQQVYFVVGTYMSQKYEILLRHVTIHIHRLDSQAPSLLFALIAHRQSRTVPQCSTVCSCLAKDLRCNRYA